MYEHEVKTGSCNMIAGLAERSSTNCPIFLVVLGIINAFENERQTQPKPC